MGLSPLCFLRAAVELRSLEPPLPSPHSTFGLPVPSHQLLSLGLSSPSPVHKHGVNLIAVAGLQLCPAPVTLSGGDAMAKLEGQEATFLGGRRRAVGGRVMGRGALPLPPAGPAPAAAQA